MVLAIEEVRSQFLSGISHDHHPLLAALPVNYWTDLAKDYETAYSRVFGGPPIDAEALAIPMCIGEHETNNGRAWPGTFDIGATQLSRGQVPQDLWNKAQSGELPAGSSFPPGPHGQSGGTLHIDTHPTATGPQPYYAWFAAFLNRVDGITYFLNVLRRLSKEAFTPMNATPTSVVTQMYLGCYFEGAHSGARPCGRRILPLTPPEQANVDDYAKDVAELMPQAMAGVNAIGIGEPISADTGDPVAGQTPDTKRNV